MPANIPTASKHSNMGRRSRAQHARIQNLSKKHPKVMIEDVTDSDDDDFVPIPDLDDVSDSESEDGFDCEDSDSEDECTHSQKPMFVLDVMDEDDRMDLEDELNEEEAAEVKNDAELLVFTNLLQEGQAAAVAAERAREAKSNQPKYYHRKSTRTQERIRQTRRNLAKAGQKFIQQFMTAPRKTTGLNSETESEEQLNTAQNVSLVA